MDRATIENMVKMMSSDNDSDAVLGLRGLLNLMRDEGVKLDRAIIFALEHAEQLRHAKNEKSAFLPKAEEKAPKKEAKGGVEISGMPQCIAPRPGCVEIIAPGKTQGEVVALPGQSARAHDEIALSLKDAFVAAIVNKSRFKLKLLDVKNNRNEVVETILQAEYERDGMTPVRIWANARGEAGALATVLRRAMANVLPELVAS